MAGHKKGKNIKNSHLIGAGGGEIKKKPNSTFAKEAAKVKGQPNKKWTEKVSSKSTSKSFAEQVRPTKKVATPQKPNPNRKPSAKPTKVVSPQKTASNKPNPHKKPVSAPVQTKTKRPPTAKKTPSKEAISHVKKTAKKVAPKKPTPHKTVAKKAPTKKR